MSNQLPPPVQVENKSNTTKILLVILGLVIATPIALGAFVVVCLVAIAAIGTDASNEFGAVSAELNAQPSFVEGEFAAEPVQGHFITSEVYEESAE